MNSIERVSLTLNRQKADRVPVFEHFWYDTVKRWQAEGHIVPGENLSRHFGFDIDELWAYVLTADMNFGQQVVEETEETILFKDGNGALLRKHKLHDSTPEHVAFDVEDADGYYKKIRHLLTPDDIRLDYDGYAKTRAICKEDNRYFVTSGMLVFEAMLRICGHENLLAGMALEPEWVKEMAMDYARLIVKLQTKLFEREGLPDAVWYYEDLGYKQSPFMSPQMYCDILQPAHRYVFDFAKGLGLPIIVHSCGYVEPLIPHLLEVGVDCLQALEVKAGMNLPALVDRFGDRLSFMGGIDARVASTNDKEVIKKELETIIPAAKAKNGYIIHSDHSIPPQVDYETYRYFLETAKSL